MERGRFWEYQSKLWHGIAIGLGKARRGDREREGEGQADFYTSPRSVDFI